MENQFTWTKGMLDSNYQLLNGGKFNSNLLFNTWKNEAQGLTSTETYSFKTEGFSNPKTNIYNKSHELIGVITYQSWQTKAIINLKSGEQFAFNFNGSWYNDWTITDFKERQINYKASNTSGFIIGNIDDELIILTGLFVKEYFARVFIFILMIVVFLPIITSSWHF